MEEIECVTLNGDIKLIPSERMSFRPAAYAILMHDRKILLLKMRHTGKYHLPGGGIGVAERIEDTLIREVAEETGITIQVERLAHFDELFFYYDPSGRTYHGLHFYYLCTPITRELISDEQVEDGSAGNPRWIEVDQLSPDDFQNMGEKVLSICRREIDGN